mgnify:CR=1 FL=1
MRTDLFFYPAIAAAVLSSCGGKKDAAEVNKKPNVLFIYADDIGYGDLSCYGGKSIITPNVEKLASEGIMFTNAHCGASTSTPSRYGMLTGEYPWRKKGTGIAAGDAAMIIKPNIYTMADMFVDAGYSTGVIGKWHLGLGDKAGQQDWNGLVSPNPSDIGFEFSHIMAATADRVPCIWIENGRALGLSPDDPVEVSYTKNFPGEPTGKDNPELLRLHPSHGHDMSIVNGISRIGYMRGGKSALWRDQDIQDSIIANAVRFIEEKSASDKPWFLYLATNDIHVPRDPHERFVGKSGHGLRGDALLSFDWGVGEVMKTLERLGIDENTIVVLSSDNGPVIDDGYKDQAVDFSTSTALAKVSVLAGTSALEDCSASTGASTLTDCTVLTGASTLADCTVLSGASTLADCAVLTDASTLADCTVLADAGFTFLLALSSCVPALSSLIVAATSACAS